LASIISTAYERIERDRLRNCWIHVRPMEEALAEADALVRRAAEGEALPLLGVPFGVKDNIDVEAMPTTAACPSFEYVAAQSARCVESLTAAGAICLGKTNLDQFATGLSGTRSPYGACSSAANDLYVSGGSSSGSAAAVASGHVASLSAQIPAARAGFPQASMGSSGSSQPSASSHPGGLCQTVRRSIAPRFSAIPLPRVEFCSG
jgi:amidase/allophanate hydrolase